MNFSHLNSFTGEEESTSSVSENIFRISTCLTPATCPGCHLGVTWVSPGTWSVGGLTFENGFIRLSPASTWVRMSWPDWRSPCQDSSFTALKMLIYFHKQKIIIIIMIMKTLRAILQVALLFKNATGVLQHEKKKCSSLMNVTSQMFFSLSSTSKCFKTLPGPVPIVLLYNDGRRNDQGFYWCFLSFTLY